MTETTSETNDVTNDLRRASDLLCLWRVCGNAACRRAGTCRGRAQSCAKRNLDVVPPKARDFFTAFLAAQWAGLPFEKFRADMDRKEETKAFFAWRRVCGK
jgi:hypothetical protein